MARRLDWTLPAAYVSPLTCFDAKGEVDARAMRAQMDYVFGACAPTAICVAGVETQEYHYLSDEARAAFIRQVAELIGGRVPFVVGVSHASIRRCAELAHLAEDLGAAAVQVLIPRRPFGGKPALAEIADYVAAVGGETRLPVVAYHHPGPGAELTVDALVQLARLECVGALKESSRDIRHVGLLVHDLQREGLGPLFVGLEVLLPGLLLGVGGGATPTPGSALAAVLLDAFRRGDIAEATRIQRLLSEMPARWFAAGLTTVMKESMRAVGLDCGLPYPPFGRLSEEERRTIHAYWEALPEPLVRHVRWPAIADRPGG